MTEPNPTFEQFKVKGSEVLDKVKEVVREGNVRRLIIKNEEGKTLVEVPLTVGVVGGLLAPVAAAIAAIAGLVKHCTIEVQRPEPTESSESDEKSA
jgi:hypothetical protein